MPKALHEIKNFNLGIMSNVDEKDSPEEAPAFSLNIDPNAKSGTLNSINCDKLTSVLDSKTSHFPNPITWGETGQIEIGNVYSFYGKSTAKISLEGTKGFTEYLNVYRIVPELEQLVDGSGASGINLTFNPSATITTADTQISIRTKNITNTDGGANIVVGNFVDGVATIELDSEDPAVLHNQTFTLVTCDGRTVEYVFKNTSGTSGADVVSDKVQIYIASLSSYDTIATQVIAAINHSNGHEERVTCAKSNQDHTNDLITVTMVINQIVQYFSPGDIIALSTTTTIVEYLLVISIDYTNNTFTVERGKFGSKKAEYATGTDFKLFASYRTINSVQRPSTRGTAYLSGWSNYSGNNIGGNSHYLNNATSSLARFYNGKIATSTSNCSITFNATDKTIVFGSAIDTSLFNFNEGDTITFYGNLSNQARSFKVLKKDDSTKTLTVDQAPVDSTESTNDVYWEANLIKNHTLHHAVDGTGINIGANTNFRINDWKHLSYHWHSISETDVVDNKYVGTSALDSGNQNTGEGYIVKTTTGGYWSETALHGGNISANRYPFESNDTHIEIQSVYKKTNVKLNEILTTGSNKFIANMAYGNDASQQIAKNDLLKIGSEYMRVTSVDRFIITVARGEFGSTVAQHAASTFVYKNINNCISQDIPKERLKKGQTYELSFFAKQGATPGSNPKIAIYLGLNGGYFNAEGNFIEYKQLDDNGCHFDDYSYKMQEEKWLDSSILLKPDGNTVSDDGIPTTWSKFAVEFTIPRNMTLETDLTIQATSRGEDSSKVAYDLFSLIQKEPAIIKHDDYFCNAGFINRQDSKDLVTYNKYDRHLYYLENFESTNKITGFNKVLANTTFFKRLDGLTTHVENLAMVSNNREVHIGFGGRQNSTFPVWLGRINHQIFGESVENLYIDEDTVHTYNESASYNLSKLCVAGEHEYIDADYNGSDTLTINHTGHSMAIGDNIVVRQWADVDNSWTGKGVWIVTGAATNTITCKRYTTLDANAANNDSQTGDNDMRINYRPYYYYGIKRGGDSIYRVFPDDRIKSDLSGIDVNYPRGRTDKSKPIRPGIQSICTSYNKKTDGTGGGHVYILFDDGTIQQVNVQESYDGWNDLPLVVTGEMQPIYKSFKWSNESTTGDKADGTQVYDSKAEFSSPSIDAHGTPSDIIETKGPVSTLDHDFSVNDISDSGTVHTYTNFTPANFDTRIWVQHYPEETEYFREGNRFLFCAKSTDDITTGIGRILYMADRTPPTTIVNGDPHYKSYREGGGFLGHNNESVYHGPGEQNHWHDGTKARRYYNTQSNGSVQQVRYAHPRNRQTITSDINDNYLQSECLKIGDGKTPVVNWGQNVGWGFNYTSFSGSDDPEFEEHIPCQIVLPMYGMFPISDNTRDGLLDGTGVPTANNRTLPAGTGSNNINPYGNWNQRVCSHAVGVMIKQNDSKVKWITNYGSDAFIGDVHSANQLHSPANNPDLGVYNQFYSDQEQNKYFQGTYGEKSAANMFVCVATDMHYGDFPLKNRYTISSIAANGSHSATLTLSEDIHEQLQPGDQVFISNATSGSWSDGEGKCTYISALVDGSNTKVVVPIDDGGSTYSGYLHPLSMHLLDNDQSVFTQNEHYFSGNSLWDGSSATEKIGGLLPTRSQINHFSFNDNDAADGTCFTETLSSMTNNQNITAGAGHFVKTYYTAQTNIGMGESSEYENSTYMPGIINRIDKLNFRAGIMMRPISITGGEFGLLNFDTAISLDMPIYPDMIYNVHGTAGGDSISIIQNTSTAVNHFATKLFISCKDEDENQKTHIFACEWNNLTVPETVYAENITSDEFYYIVQGYWYQGYNKRYTGIMMGGDVPMTIAEAEGTSNRGPFISGSLQADAIVAASSTHPNADYCPVLDCLSSTKFAANSRYAKQGALTGLCISVKDSTYGTIETRYIVGSRPNTTGQVYIDVHFPFGRKPLSGDTYYIWRHSQVCTSPVHLFKHYSSNGMGLLNKRTPGGIKPLNTSFSATMAGSSTAITFTTTEQHHLNTGDVVSLGIHGDVDIPSASITVTGPKTFTIATESYSTASGSISVTVKNEDGLSSVSNPMTISNIQSPTLKTFFGGFDMRKAIEINATNADGDNTTDVLRITADNKFQAGDMITFDGNDADHDGTYEVKDSSATTIDVYNTSSDDDSDSTQAITTNQWEILLNSVTGPAKAGEIRLGHNSWDTGISSANPIRRDKETADDYSLYMAKFADGITIEPASDQDGSGDYFKRNTGYRYKVSFIYDGYQEGPLSPQFWEFSDNAHTYSKVLITLNLINYSKRLTHVCIYRKNGVNDTYKLVKEVSTSKPWSFHEGARKKQVIDDGTLSETFYSRSGISEVLSDISVKYGLSTEAGGYLFVGDCFHNDIDNAKNQIFRSKPGKFSIFDWATDFLVLESTPTAMANFAGRLFVFDEKNTYKINYEQLIIEDKFEGIGCSSPNSIVVTEFGMFFADRNGAYMHNGTSPAKLSTIIHRDLDTDTTFNGLETIPDISWSNTAGPKENMPPYVVFDSEANCALFFVEHKTTKTTGGLTKGQSNYYCWSYHVQLNRWDLWEAGEDCKFGVPFTGKYGDVYIIKDSSIYKYKGGEDKRLYTWLSKKMTMEQDSALKVFNKIKINGIEATLNLGGSYKESSDNLLVATNNGALASSEVVYSSRQESNSTYKLSGNNKTGRWLQVKLENVKEELDSLGFVFRKRPVK